MTTPDPFAAPEPGATPPRSTPPSYGQPAYGQPGYGPGYGPPPAPGAVPQPYGYPVAPQNDGKAIVALVLAVCSFVVLPVIPAVVALVLASSAERDIAASGGRLTGLTLVRAARITAWVHLGLCLAFVLVLVLVFGAFGAAVFAG